MHYANANGRGRVRLCARHGALGAHTTSIPFQFLVLTISIPITDKDDLLCCCCECVCVFLLVALLVRVVSLVIDFD